MDSLDETAFAFVFCLAYSLLVLDKFKNVDGLGLSPIYLSICLSVYLSICLSAHREKHIHTVHRGWVIYKRFVRVCTWGCVVCI